MKLISPSSCPGPGCWKRYEKPRWKLLPSICQCGIGQKHLALCCHSGRIRQGTQGLKAAPVGSGPMTHFYCHSGSPDKLSPSSRTSPQAWRGGWDSEARCSYSLPIPTPLVTMLKIFNFFRLKAKSCFCQGQGKTKQNKISN